MAPAAAPRRGSRWGPSSSRAAEERSSSEPGSGRWLYVAVLGSLNLLSGQQVELSTCCPDNKWIPQLVVRTTSRGPEEEREGIEGGKR